MSQTLAGPKRSLFVSSSFLQRASFNSPPVEEPCMMLHEVLRSPGQPLDTETRATAESRFGHDFSHVRVHTNEKAAGSARAMGANAYTMGHDIVFGQGQYKPQSSAGQRLLIHELTHVVQQKGANSRTYPNKDWQFSQVTDVSEREADRASRLVDFAQPIFPINSVTGGVIARESIEELDVQEEPIPQDNEGLAEIETTTSNEFELCLPAGAAKTNSPSTKKPSIAGPQKKASRPQTYLTHVNLKLPNVGGPDRSLDTAQISRLANNSANTTAGATKFIIPYQTQVKQSHKGTKHWVTAINVWLNNPTLKVFLTKQDPIGSCADKDLLRHEMQHVSDIRKNTANGEKNIREAFAPGTWPDIRHPLDNSIISRHDLFNEITTLVAYQIWEIQYSNWLDGCSWDTVDYPRMYSSCPGMKPANTTPKCDPGSLGKPPEVFAPPLPKKQK